MNTREELRAFLESFTWTHTLTLSPSHPHHSAITAIHTAERLLRIAEERFHTTIAGILIAEPHPGTEVYHLHGVLQADLAADDLASLAACWGQAAVERYDPGGGWVGYIAGKIAGGCEWSIHGTPTREEEWIEF